MRRLDYARFGCVYVWHTREGPVHTPKSKMTLKRAGDVTMWTLAFHPCRLHAGVYPSYLAVAAYPREEGAPLPREIEALEGSLILKISFDDFNDLSLPLCCHKT